MQKSPPIDTRPGGVYVHFPFCSIRCAYCDFPTVTGQDDRIEPYIDALERECDLLDRSAPDRVDSLFFGGGTPSRMSPAQLERVMRALRGRFALSSDCEVTLEANPESVSLDKLGRYRERGVNRLSIGVQSLDDSVLAGVGRAHDSRRAASALRDARAAGFDSINLDLIAGLPGEQLSLWERTLQRVCALEPDHISVYLLETDKNSPLARAVRHGRMPVADDDRLAEAYRRTVSFLDGSGFAQYEISNFARPGHRSRHNLKYWTDAPYVGLGLGAHSYFDGARRSNRDDLEGYLEDLRLRRSPCDRADPWHARRRLEEALMLGLRLVEGIDLGTLGRRYGADPREEYRTVWKRAHEAGLLERQGDRVCLTMSGRLCSNELFAELLDA